MSAEPAANAPRGRTPAPQIAASRSPRRRRGTTRRLLPDRLGDLPFHHRGGGSQKLADASHAKANPPDEAMALGLGRGEFHVLYQPVVRLADRRPVMVEALARWQRGDGPVTPDEFMPIAERTGLVGALSSAVASLAARELGQLRGALRLDVSLNVPLRLLLQRDLTVWLGRAFSGSGLTPSVVALELTETTPVHDFAELQTALLRLAAAGYRVLLDDIALDDGRARLRGLPFAGFKLDRGLVAALPDDGRARREVLGLVRHAERHNQLVVAEGVADQRLWQATRALGVHHAQGFGIARPMPAAALPAWCSGWRGGGAITR